MGVAPSLLPQTPGDRVNTDRRDAVPWASLARSGDLTAVDVPTGAAEAMRDLTRARDDASRARHDAQLRLNAVWLRHASRYTGPAHGGAAHRRWLSAGVGPTPAPPSVLQAYVRAVNDHSARLPRLAQARQAHVNAWRVSPVVEALPAWRGVPLTVAVTLVAAMGDLTRVEPPRDLRQCMGLMPSASSSGEPRRQGAMTQAGHTPARRVRVDGAWAYRDPAQLRRHWPRRLEHHPTVIQDMRWKAHVRRCPRDRRLVARGQHAHVVTVAMARELTGFMGAMATEVSGIASDQDGSGSHAPRRSAPLGKVDPRASAETPPRCGVTLGGVQRLVQATRASSEAGTRRTHVRWDPTHGYQPDQPSCLPGSASSDGQHEAMGTSDEDIKSCADPLTSEGISTPFLRGDPLIIRPSRI
jgi:transposase